MTHRSYWAALVVLALGACEFVAGLHEIEFVSTTAGGTGGSGGAVHEGGTGGGVCEHAGYPSPPSASDPGADDVAFILAARRLDFGETDLQNGPLVGYDLDGLCTCQGQGDSCKEPEFADAEHCDGPAGRDNAVARLFAQAGAFSADLSSEVHTQRAEMGLWTFLVRVDAYNGMPNDLDVRLAIYVSPGFDVDPCTPATMPAWDGNDAWPVGHTSIEPPNGTGGMGGGGTGGSSTCIEVAAGYDVDQPRFVDPRAYVTNGTLVASLAEVGIALEAGSVMPEIRLTAGFLTGELIRDTTTGRWRIENGVLAGRWQVKNVMAAVAAMLSDGELVCTDHPFYRPIEEAVCGHVDIASTLGGPTTPCDALSAALGFGAEQAQLGSVYITPGVPAGCPPELDPANDDCP